MYATTQSRSRNIDFCSLAPKRTATENNQPINPSSNVVCLAKERALWLYAGDALRRGDRVAGLVGAIVIDHVVQTNPSVTSGLQRSERLVGRAFPPVVGVRGALGWPRHCAPLYVKVLVISVEWGFAPIYLLQTTPCGPVVSFP